MATQETPAICSQHGNVLGRRQSSSHAVHLILFFITLGLWLPFWILVSIRFGGWKCPHCGGSARRRLSRVDRFIYASLALFTLPVVGVVMIAAFSWGGDQLPSTTEAMPVATEVATISVAPKESEDLTNGDQVAAPEKPDSTLPSFDEVLRDHNSWPLFVFIKRQAEIPIYEKGRDVGTRGVPAGERVALREIREDGSLALVSRGSTFYLDYQETNLLDQILIDRETAREASRLAEQRRSEAEAARQAAEDAKLAALEAVIGARPGFPRTTGWLGGSPPVKRFLEKNLKDPGSIEYVGWAGPELVEVEGEPFWRIYVRYRARNSFGGMAVEEGHAYLRHNIVLAFE